METSYFHGLAGGCLIGLGSLLAMVVTGKIPGISGVFGRLFRPKKNDVSWRIHFLCGLIAGAAVLIRSNDFAEIFRVPGGRTLTVYAVAGLLVGFGTRLGGGCTSGHGVCGIGMGARDSMVATVVFMANGMITVWLFRHWVIGA